MYCSSRELVRCAEEIIPGKQNHVNMFSYFGVDRFLFLLLEHKYDTIHLGNLISIENRWYVGNWKYSYFQWCIVYLLGWIHTMLRLLTCPNKSLLKFERSCKNDKIQLSFKFDRVKKVPKVSTTI